MRIKPDIHRPRTAGIDITAMVDVVFLLMVFFLTTLSIDQIVRTQVDLPDLRGEQRDEEPTPGVIINVQRDGSLVVENRPETVESTLLMVAAEVRNRGGAAGVDVLVRADAEAPLRTVNDLARGLIDLNIPDWRLATDPGGAAP